MNEISIGNSLEFQRIQPGLTAFLISFVLSELHCHTLWCLTFLLCLLPNGIFTKLEEFPAGSGAWGSWWAQEMCFPSLLLALWISDFLQPKLSVLPQVGLLGVCHKMGAYNISVPEFSWERVEFIPLSMSNWIFCALFCFFLPEYYSGNHGFDQIIPWCKWE